MDSTAVIQAPECGSASCWFMCTYKGSSAPVSRHGSLRAVQSEAVLGSKQQVSIMAASWYGRRKQVPQTSLVDGLSAAFKVRCDRLYICHWPLSSEQSHHLVSTLCGGGGEERRGEDRTGRHDRIGEGRRVEESRGGEEERRGEERRG